MTSCIYAGMKDFLRNSTYHLNTYLLFLNASERDEKEMNPLANNFFPKLITM
jgi:hypothetical protein